MDRFNVDSLHLPRERTAQDPFTIHQSQHLQGFGSSGTDRYGTTHYSGPGFGAYEYIPARGPARPILIAGSSVTVAGLFASLWGDVKSTASVALGGHERILPGGLVDR